MNKILIKNGLVYDPVLHVTQKRDVAICGPDIVPLESFNPEQIVDASGCIVTPGLIDFHLHCYTGGSDGTSDVDSCCLPNGVTTCVDGGTAGSANMEGFYWNVISRSVTRVFTLLHVCPEGLVTSCHGENQTPAYWDIEHIQGLCKKYSNEIVGLKVRMSVNILDPYGLHDEPLIEAVKLGNQLGEKIVVHVNNPNVDTQVVAGHLRPGDVFCHVYAGSKENILDSSGKIKLGIWNARKRGVLFDACNGRGNFLFRVAEPAIQQGFLPDFISTDMNPLVLYKQPVISLPRLMSKYLMFGMKLEDVFDRVTLFPARWLGCKNLATLAVGTESDVSIWKLKEKRICFLDVTGEKRWGKQVLIPQLTIRNGSIVYCQSDFL